MKTKSLISLLLVMCLCLTLMCACSRKGDDGTASTGDEVVATETEEKENTPKDIFNILLIGVDEINDLGASDAILMLSIDNTDRKLKITSFNRDTYVYTSSLGNVNLNKIYSPGKVETLVKAIEDNFSVNIDRYALANYFTFEDMLDAVGGVEMTLTKDEIAYINAMMKEQGSDKQIAEDAGLVKLSSAQALCHMRNRTGPKGEDDEFSRSRRQREFLKALIETFKNATAQELTDMATVAVPMLNTDMTAKEKVSLVNGIFTYLTYTVEECSMPSEGSFSIAGGKSDPRVIVDDWDKTKSELNEFLY